MTCAHARRVPARCDAGHRIRDNVGPKRAPLLAAAAAVLALGACATVATGRPGATFVLVRHAEKSGDAADPGLTDAGRARAARLAAELHDAPLVAVYATQYRRTRETAAPSAADHRVPVTPYDAASPAVDFATRLRATHATGTVLVVGHSNTVPALARALCGCPIGPTGESDYGRRITVRLLPGGDARVDDRRDP